jgi:hypothetical protein
VPAGGRYAAAIGSSASTTPPAPQRLRARLRPPLWAQWAISLAVAIAAIVALVRFVDANSTPAAQAPHISPKGQKSLNAEAIALDGELQAPQVAHYAPGVAPRAAIERAVAAYMTGQIDTAQLQGPLRESLCFAVPGGAGSHLAYRCSALASSQSFPFEGIVDPVAHTVTYCRHNPPPVRGVTVPLSRRCLA